MGEGRKPPFALDWDRCQVPQIPSAVGDMLDAVQAEITAAFYASFDLARAPSQTAYTRVSFAEGELVFTPISAAEFYALEDTATTPTGDQS